MDAFPFMNVDILDFCHGSAKIKELMSHVLSSEKLYGNSGTLGNLCLFSKCASLVTSGPLSKQDVL